MINGRENTARAIEFKHPAHLPGEPGVPLDDIAAMREAFADLAGHPRT